MEYLRPKDGTTPRRSTRQGAESAGCVRTSKRSKYSNPTWAPSGEEIPSPASDAEKPSVHLMEHAKVFAMDVKYRVDRLRHLATLKFKEAVTTIGRTRTLPIPSTSFTIRLQRTLRSCVRLSQIQFIRTSKSCRRNLALRFPSAALRR